MLVIEEFVVVLVDAPVAVVLVMVVLEAPDPVYVA